MFRHNEDAQKRLAENAEVEQLSDPNRPSEVARRYGDLFQRTYDVVDVLEERDVDEDTCNRFVEMLKVDIKAVYVVPRVPDVLLVDIKRRSYD